MNGFTAIVSLDLSNSLSALYFTALFPLVPTDMDVPPPLSCPHRIAYLASFRVFVTFCIIPTLNIKIHLVSCQVVYDTYCFVMGESIRSKRQADARFVAVRTLLTRDPQRRSLNSGDASISST